MKKSIKSMGKSTKKPVDISKHMEKAVSGFEKEYAKLKKLVGGDAKEFNHNASSIATSRAMLASVLDMIPLAEKAYHERPGQSTAYSFAALVNLTRELSNDIRNLVDLQGQVDHIIENIVDPSLVTIIQNSIQDVFKMQSDFKARIPGSKSRAMFKQVTSSYLEKQAERMEKTKEAISKQLLNYMCDRK